MESGRNYRDTVLLKHTLASGGKGTGSECLLFKAAILKSSKTMSSYCLLHAHSSLIRGCTRMTTKGYRDEPTVKITEKQVTMPD
jgi:hypothetical protein